MGIYGNPEKGQKWRTWRLMERLADGCSVQWLCVGDFNEILADNEKSGGNLMCEYRMRYFKLCVEMYGLIDLGFEGSHLHGPTSDREAIISKRG